MSVIYHLAQERDWQAAQAAGAYRGPRSDRGDDFLHFSTAGQVADSAAIHCAGATDLVLLAVDAARLGDSLRWEPSRGGQDFPHLYADLPLDAVLWARPLPLDSSGAHRFPSLD